MRYAIQYHTGELVKNSCDQVRQFFTRKDAQKYIDSTVDDLLRNGYSIMSKIVSRALVVHALSEESAHNHALRKIYAQHNIALNV